MAQLIDGLWQSHRWRNFLLFDILPFIFEKYSRYVLGIILGAYMFISNIISLTYDCNVPDQSYYIISAKLFRGYILPLKNMYYLYMSAE